MLKFTSVLAFVVLCVAAFIFAFITEAAPLKWTQLSADYSYPQYLKDHGKKPAADANEYALREKLFNDELKQVLAHNADKTQLYKKGINKFSDWTQSEKKRLNGGRAIEMRETVLELQKKPYHKFHAKSGRSSFPLDFDWRDVKVGGKNPVISAVKDQGQCGSCWAHGSTETLESHYAIATGQLFVLSQQEVTSCSQNPSQCGGQGGCLGSISQLAFAYIIENGGQAEEWMYPYTAYYGTTGACAIPAGSSSVAKFSTYTTVLPNDQDAVLDALTTVGPLAVNVDASAWSNYESGIYNGCNYAMNISIDHVVQLVGYGIDSSLNNQKYWTIRNSWSASYGESGYIRLIRHDTPECGWNVNTGNGVACKPYPQQQWVCGQCGVLFDTSYVTAAVPPQ